MLVYMQHPLSMILSFLTGHCVTAATSGNVCGLNSIAVGCNRTGLSATACRCYQTPQAQQDPTCQGRGEERVGKRVWEVRRGRRESV